MISSVALKISVSSKYSVDLLKMDLTRISLPSDDFFVNNRFVIGLCDIVLELLWKYRGGGVVVGVS